MIHLVEGSVALVLSRCPSFGVPFWDRSLEVIEVGRVFVMRFAGRYLIGPVQRQ